MELRKLAGLVLERLERLYPAARTALHWTNPLELLVAVVLSAQCTDERVNRVTPSLFKKYTSAAGYRDADPSELEEDIRPTGFFRNKAKNIIGASAVIADEHNGRVPKTMPELLLLPGIARKSANIILAEAYGLIAGIPVDTHVARLTKRIGLTKQNDPPKIEAEMMRILPEPDWYKFSSVLIYHGRAVCAARKPKCDACVLNDTCVSAFTF